jgi:hypothetical protein
MSDVRWDDVREIFVREGHGTLFRVVDTTASSWQAVLDLVRSRRWRHDYEEEGAAVPMPERATDILDRAEDANPALWVWPNSVLLAVFDPVCAQEVEFSIDLLQVQGQQRFDLLCEFLRTIGQLLDRPVIMARDDDDSDTDVAYLAYRPEVDRFMIVRPPGGK